MFSSCDELILNVAKIKERSYVNGPGNRFVIWLQGCSLRCDDCINPQFWERKQNKLISVSELYYLILNTSNIEGVTYSGGEPFEQAKGLYCLSKLLKQKGLTLVSYSGFTYNEILNSNDKYRQLLLFNLDVLIAGRYDKKKTKPLLWRSSSNQKIHFLTDRYKDYKKIASTNKMQIEFSVYKDKVAVTGNFSRKILENINNKMKLYGIEIQNGKNNEDFFVR